MIVVNFMLIAVISMHNLNGFGHLIFQGNNDISEGNRRCPFLFNLLRHLLFCPSLKLMGSHYYSDFNSRLFSNFFQSFCEYYSGVFKVGIIISYTYLGMQTLYPYFQQCRIFTTVDCSI